MIKSVKEILEDDFWIMPATPEYKTEGIPYITYKNIKNGSIDFGNVNYISEEDYESISKNRPIKSGDILISMIGTLGETAEVTELDGKFYGQNMFLVRLNKEKINKRYFLNYFQSGSVKRALAGSQNQSTQRYLKANHIEDLQIPVPNLEEQLAMAQKLDLLSEVIVKRKQEIDMLDNLIKARFVETFGDPRSNPNGLSVKTLDQLGVWNSGGTPSRTNPEYFTGKINWYSAGELNSLYLDGSVEKITEEAINESAAKLFKAGSMLVGMYDTAAFKMGILKEDSASNQACACIEPNESVDIVWLYYALTMMKDFYLSQRRGVRQKNLNLGMIRGFELPVASKKEQEIFVEFVKQVDKSKFAVQKSLDETQKLFDSLMQEYFG